MEVRYKKISLILVGIILGIMTSLTPVLLVAQQAGSASSADNLNKDYYADCRIQLKPFIATEEQSFREFVDKTLKNKSDASSLLRLLTERYQQMRSKLVGEYLRYQTKIGNDIADSYQQLVTCQAMVNASLSTAEALLKKQALTNAQAKKATKLVTKFKDINRKLGDMQMEVATMKGYFDSFENKLPCYVSQCVR